MMTGFRSQTCVGALQALHSVGDLPRISVKDSGKLENIQYIASRVKKVANRVRAPTVEATVSMDTFVGTTAVG